MKTWHAVLAASFLLSAGCQSASAAERVVLTPAATVTAHESGLQKAIFSGGCFWGVEGVFSHTKGVTSAINGYQGGSKATADYETVSTGKTGHAESVEVTYNPKVVRYDQLLRVFFSVIADPTQLNYQGPDHGTQYRSALVPLDAEQRKVATAYLAQLKKSDVWKQPIVTKIEPDKGFFPAEAHHQDFMKNNPDQGYITYWDVPKVQAMKKLFPNLYSANFQTG